MAFTLKNTFEKYHWVTNENIFVTGFISSGEKYISGDAFLKEVSENSASFENFKKFAEQLNGQFAIVVFKKTEKWAFCSHTWSYPLFYKYDNNNNVYISDNPQKLLSREQEPEPHSFTKLYFQVFGVTPGNSTLKNGIFQVQPGELIRFGKNKSETFPFSLFSLTNKKTESETVSEERLQNILMAVFEKYFNYLKNKPILLPLTKGYDSRLLGCLLKEFGHRDVICATWGRNQNMEHETAQKVASQLGYEHIFIDYSKEVPNGFTRTQTFEDFIGYSGHFSSMPFLQDYFAIRTLKNKKIIDNQTIALPGHPGDFLRGSHLDSKMTANDSSYMISKIIDAFGSSFPLRTDEEKRIREYISQTFFARKDESLWKNYEQWDYEERQCKFIGNSSLVFPFFGLESMMPLFDLEILRFFQKVPVEQKLGAKLYNNTLETFFFKKHQVDFDLKSSNHDGIIFNPFKNKLLKITPHAIKKWYYPLEDPIFYHEITKELQASEKSFSYKHPLMPHRFNSYIIQWYLQYIEKIRIPLEK